MTITSVHPAYAANYATWSKVRTAFAGEDAVKAEGTTYLQKIDRDQTSEEYGAYKSRAVYFEAVSRVVHGSVGAIARRDHAFALPDQLAYLLDNATADGVGLGQLAKMLAIELLLPGRAGILVDIDTDTQRPYLRVYEAEAITNWGDFGIVLSELTFAADPENAFALRTEVQYRQLHLVDGHYTVTLWQRPSATEPFVPSLAASPTRRGKPLDAIPFVWCSPMGNTARISPPPLLGLVNASMAYYRTSADLQHGRHWSGLPTLYAFGIETDAPIRVGGGAAIQSSNPAAKVGYAEFTGQGLQSLENGLAETLDLMSALGAAMFSGRTRRVAETAESARSRTAGETSILASVVDAVEAALQAALGIAADWGSARGMISVQLNREFQDVAMDPAMLRELTASLVAGAITAETFAAALTRAELLAPAEG